MDDMCVLIVKIECKAHRAARGTYGHSANESHDCGILPPPSPRRTRSQLPVQVSISHMSLCFSFSNLQGLSPSAFSGPRAIGFSWKVLETEDIQACSE